MSFAFTLWNKITFPSTSKDVTSSDGYHIVIKAEKVGISFSSLTKRAW